MSTPTPTERHAARLARLRGLYAITPDNDDTGALLHAVTAVLSGGARIVQYRNKRVDAMQRREQGEALRQLTRAHDALLIINDDAPLALALDADGVHIGRDDGDVAATRRLIGPERLLGVSCYNDWAIAEASLAAGADHVAFGAAFASSTKPGAVHAPLALYRKAREQTRAPIVAIGGIELHNAGSLLACGVDAIAVISALFGATDPRSTAAAFSALYARVDTDSAAGRSGRETP